MHCNDCGDARRAGCALPSRCFALAFTLSELIRPKWNLVEVETCDNLTLTRSRLSLQKSALDNGGDVLFNPSVTERGSVSEAFRVFTDPAIRGFPPAIRAPRGIVVNSECTLVCIASLARAHRTTSTNGEGVQSLVGVFFAHQDARNRRIVPPCQGRCNDDLSCECLGMLYAARQVPRDAPLTFLLANSCSIKALVVSTPSWEDNGWIGVASAKSEK